MTKASANHLQAKQLNTGCLNKHRYETEEEAYQKGQDTYPCVYCGGYHRTSIKKPAPARTNRNGIPVLDKPKRKAAPVVSTPKQPKAKPTISNEKQQIAALQKKVANLVREVETTKAAISRHKAENRRLRARYDRSIEGRAEKLFYTLLKRFRRT